MINNLFQSAVEEILMCAEDTGNNTLNKGNYPEGYTPHENALKIASAMQYRAEQSTGRSARGIMDCMESALYHAEHGDRYPMYKDIRNIEAILISLGLMGEPDIIRAARATMEELETIQKRLEGISDRLADTVDDLKG